MLKPLEENDIQLLGAPPSLAEAREELLSAGDQNINIQTVSPPPPYPADSLGDDMPLYQPQRALSIQEPPRYQACVPQGIKYYSSDYDILRDQTLLFSTAVQTAPPAYFQVS